MDKDAVLGIVRRFGEALQGRGIRLAGIVLYGSYAAGTQTPNSDIDLVVLSRDFEGRSYWERIKILADAIYEVFAPIEAVAMTPAEWERGDSEIADFARNGETITP